MQPTLNTYQGTILVTCCPVIVVGLCSWTISIYIDAKGISLHYIILVVYVSLQYSFRSWIGLGLWQIESKLSLMPIAFMEGSDMARHLVCIRSFDQKCFLLLMIYGKTANVIRRFFPVKTTKNVM